MLSDKDCSWQQLLDARELWLDDTLTAHIERLQLDGLSDVAERLWRALQTYKQDVLARKRDEDV